MKKLAIFGGAGFIGQNFIETFGEQYDLTIFGRKVSHELSIGESVYRYKQIAYTDAELATSLSNFDVVVNLSSPKVQKDLYMKDYMEGAYLAYKLMRASIAAKCDKYIHVSSRLVYKKTSPFPWNEMTPEEPDSYYGLAKLLADKLLLLYIQQQSTTEMISLRAAQVYGLLSDQIDPQQKNSLIMKCIERAEAGLSLEIQDGSTGSRDYVYIQDIVRALDLTIRKQVGSGIFNIGSGNTYSTKDVAMMVNEVFDNPSGIEIITSKIVDDVVVKLDISKANKELGYAPLYNLYRGLKEIKEKRGRHDRPKQY